MNTSTQHTPAQAFVINSDGTRTATQVTFTDHRSTRAGAQQPGHNGFSGSNGYGPVGGAGTNPFAQTPGFGYAQANGTAGAVQPRLHLGRRLAGLGIAALGVPMLLLPGPGLAMIGIGLAMALLP